jgi:thiol-disulfide isomerase/thioredoxin/protocatechuate 3,4-dioxygenase beta subunit
MLRLAGWVLLCMLAILPWEQVRAELVLQLNPTSDWSEGWGANPKTHRWEKTPLDNGAMRFTINEPGHAAVFNFGTRLEIDPRITPLLQMTYRAEHVSPSREDHPLLVFYGLENRKQLTAVTYKDIQVDGQEHTFKINLLELLEKKKWSGMVLPYIDLRIFAGKEQPGVFDLIDLRLTERDDLPAIPVVNDAAQAPQPQRGKAVSVEVVDEVNQPIAGARVTLDDHLRGGLKVTSMTDNAGKATLQPSRADFPGTRKRLRIEAENRFAVTYMRLGEVDDQTVLKVQLFPTRIYTGKVVDEAGKPVAGGIGELWEDGLPRLNGPGRPTYPRYLRVISDDQGVWATPPLPVHDNYTLNIRWRVPGYVEDRWGGQYSGRLNQADVLAGKAVSVLKRGVEVTGIVVDQDGKPIAKAQVAQGDDRFPSNAPPETRTDENGCFRFANTPQGKLVLTAKASGRAPELVELDVQPGLQPVQFKLGEAAKFHFLVIDKDFNPIANAMICPDTWRGYRTIPGSFRTNKEGLATWSGPHDPVEFDVLSRGMIDNRDLVFSPSKDEYDVHVVTLRAPLELTASVTDAVTGKPIPNFKVVHGIKFSEEGNPSWQRRSYEQRVGKDGKFEDKITDHYPYRMVRIEADGYAPVESKTFSLKEEKVDLTFKLQPATNLQGTVVTADNKPVAGATVYLTTGNHFPYATNGRMTHFRDGLSAVTNPEGLFTFLPQEKSAKLLVICDQGYFYCTVDELNQQDHKITLNPWCQLSGKVMVGDKPDANGHVSVFRYRGAKESFVNFHNDVQADAQGNFHFDRLEAGDSGVSRYIQLSENSHGTANSIRVNITADHNEPVIVGGTGRAVIGRIAWPEGATVYPLTEGHHGLSTATDYRKLHEQFLPEGFDTWDMEKRQQYIESDEGKKAFEAYNKVTEKLTINRKHYGFAINSDGTFRIDDVLPGTYMLNVSIDKPLPGRSCGNGDSVGQVNQEVTVSELAEGVTYDPVPMDLGTISITPIKPPLGVGDAAADFDVPLLPTGEIEGEIDLTQLPHFKLSDHKGKVVLIDFWATWCGPCISEMPSLKKVWDTYGQDENFAMISLAMDDKPLTTVKYLKANDMPWNQGFLGAMTETTPVASDYGVRGIPAIWLIGPDGKIIGNRLRSHNTFEAVRKALEALQSN